MESKHTKGRWKINHRARLIRVRYRVTVGKLPNVKGSMVKDHLIAGVYGNSFEEAEANAKLIASAPELLEALTALYKCAKIYGAFADTDDINGKALAQAAAIINKASI